jgi:hypothetical protein
MLKRLFSTSVLVALVWGSASGANAFTSDKRTYFTFSQSVALPGVTLPAGTYMFRLADDTTSRKVIQIANKEGTQSFAMLHTMPVYRADAPREPEVRFMETAAGAPMAVRAWWQEGERTGYGFVYSKQELAALNRAPAAVAAKAEVRIEESAVEAEAARPVAEGPLSGPDVIDGPGVPSAEGPLSGPDVIDGPGVPFEEAGAEAVDQIAQAQPSRDQAPPPPADARQGTTREELPRTASPLALLLLGGLASTSFGVRLMRKS